MIIIIWDHKPLLVLWYYYIVGSIIIDKENMQHISGTLFRSGLGSCPASKHQAYKHPDPNRAIVERTECFCALSLPLPL